MCRVPPRGPAMKAAVDAAVDRCASIGDIRKDILECKRAADSGKDDENGPSAGLKSAAELGLTYLRRYYQTVCYRSFLESPASRLGEGLGTSGAFARWLDARPELAHLKQTLKLEE
mmetsp:Transcript_37215/g.117142  ORF Transcript_37215/g.117142 Transcript_37215/m.117142 type:complete len:116 (+) Transcript_37215:1-348(+)